MVCYSGIEGREGWNGSARTAWWARITVCLLRQWSVRVDGTTGPAWTTWTSGKYTRLPITVPEYAVPMTKSLSVTENDKYNWKRRGVYEMSVRRSIYWGPTDRWPTNDLTFGKISNGHISARGHPIHFMFGSTVGFSGSADRMALFSVSTNPRWRPSRHLGIQMAISSDLLRVWF